MAWITDSLRGAIEAVGRLNPFTRAGLGGSTALPGIFTHQLAIAAYMASGMMKKVISIPAEDRVREWRDWQADAKAIEAIEAEERRLSLQAKVQEAENLRGIGGGALIIITAGDHASELKPDQVRKGGIVAVNVVSRWQITGKDWIKDLASPRYGEPTMWEMQGDKGDQVRIHPSRVICFRGARLPAGSAVADDEAFWGDSRLLRVYTEVTRSDETQAWFAALVRKAKLLRIGIPDLDSRDPEQLNKRIEVIALGESSLNATVYRSSGGQDDAGETITDYQVTWAGIPAMMDAFDQRVSAVSDIPFTRLLGRSPAGMNATGQHDMDNWNKAVVSGQKLETRPCLEQLDPFLIRSAGADPAKVTWKFAPLSVPTEKEEADTFNVTMDAVTKLQATGAIPDEAFAKGLQNLMTEREYIPGLDQALADIPENERFGLNPDDDGTGDDPSKLQAGKEGDPASAGGGTNVPARRAVNDGGVPTGSSPFEDGNKHHWGRGARGGQFKSGPGGGGSPGDYVGRAIGGGRGQKQRPVGDVSPSAARLVKQRTGIDIAGKELRLDHSGIAHAWKNHGPEGKVHGAKALTKGDLVRAATGLNQATDVRPAKSRGMNGPRFEATYTNRRGTMTVIYETSSKAVYPMNAWWVK
ncbi:phage portal protein [Novosphingobium lindaniclasticum]